MISVHDTFHHTETRAFLLGVRTHNTKNYVAFVTSEIFAEQVRQWFTIHLQYFRQVATHLCNSRFSLGKHVVQPATSSARNLDHGGKYHAINTKLFVPVSYPIPGQSTSTVKLIEYIRIVIPLTPAKRPVTPTRRSAKRTLKPRKLKKSQVDSLVAHKNKTICLIKTFFINKMPLEFDILVFKAFDSKIQRKKGTFSFIDF